MISSVASVYFPLVQTTQKLSLYFVIEDLDAVSCQGSSFPIDIFLLTKSFVHAGPFLRLQDVIGHLLSVTWKKVDHPSPISLEY